MDDKNSSRDRVVVIFRTWLAWVYSLGLLEVSNDDKDRGHFLEFISWRSVHFTTHATL